MCKKGQRRQVRPDLLVRPSSPSQTPPTHLVLLEVVVQVGEEVVLLREDELAQRLAAAAAAAAAAPQLHLARNGRVLEVRRGAGQVHRRAAWCNVARTGTHRCNVSEVPGWVRCRRRAARVREAHLAWRWLLLPSPQRRARTQSPTRPGQPGTRAHPRAALSAPPPQGGPPPRCCGPWPPAPCRRSGCPPRLAWPAARHGVSSSQGWQHHTTPAARRNFASVGAQGTAWPV